MTIHVSPLLPVPGVPATLRRTITSELLKLTSLRSQVVLIAVTAAFLAALGPVQSLGQVASRPDQPVGSSGAALSLAMSGVSPASLLLGILGVLVVAGEYTPRAVRSTFAMVPRRGYVVLARAIALALVTSVVGVVTVTAAVAGSLEILASGGSSVGWDSPHVLRVSAATVWYLVGWALFGLAAGWTTRSKLGGAALLFGVMMLLGPVLALLPGRVGELAPALLPSAAGGAMVGTQHADTWGSPAVGFLVWTAYVALSVVTSAWSVGRRDA